MSLLAPAPAEPTSSLHQASGLARNAGSAKILFMIDGMAALTDGGTERQLLQLIAVARSAGLLPTVCVLRETQWLTPEIAGCPVHYASFYSVRGVAGWRELGRLLGWMQQQRFAVLQTFFTDANLLGPMLGRLAGIATILGTRRSLNPARARGLRASAVRLLAGVSHRCVTRVLTNAEAVSRNIAETERLPARKLAVVYNGVDVAAWRRQPELGLCVRKRLHVGERELLVGNVSGLRPVKALDTFVRAAALVVARAPQFRFVIVGEGAVRAELEALIAALGLGRIVTLTGAEEDVRPYLAAMDVGVLCSEAEGFSNSILEYMAARLPVVATDVGGNREALGEAGLLVPARDEEALAQAILALADAEVRARHSAAVYARVQRFSIDAAKARMRAIYREHCPLLQADAQAPATLAPNGS